MHNYYHQSWRHVLHGYISFTSCTKCGQNKHSLEHGVHALGGFYQQWNVSFSVYVTDQHTVHACIHATIHIHTHQHTLAAVIGYI